MTAKPMHHKMIGELYRTFVKVREDIFEFEATPEQEDELASMVSTDQPTCLSEVNDMNIKVRNHMVELLGANAFYEVARSQRFRAVLLGKEAHREYSDALGQMSYEMNKLVARTSVYMMVEQRNRSTPKEEQEVESMVEAVVSAALSTMENLDAPSQTTSAKEQVSESIPDTSDLGAPHWWLATMDSADEH